MRNYPRVAIVFSQAKENIDDLVECLDSLNEVVYNNLYAIIVNNGVKNLDLKKNLKDISRYNFDITFLEIKNNKGFAGGNNLGIKQAILDKSDYILLLSDDTTVDKYFLINLIKFFKTKKKIGILGPVILRYNDNRIQSTGGYINLWKGEAPLLNYDKKLDDLKGNYIKSDYISGCAMLISSKIFKIVGLLDENYYPGYYEDTDFGYRVRRKGFDVYCVYNSIIWHKDSRYFQRYSLFEKESILIKNQILFMFNNVNLLRFLFFMIYLILTYPFSNNFQNIHRKWKNIVLAISNILRIMIFK